MKYDIGDIVYVQNYVYKNGQKGSNHSFVIIDEEQAIEINYFGFLLSSKLDKRSYPYNEFLGKDNINKLRKDGIVKCDDLIQMSEKEIQFKIGKVTEEDLNRFLDTYEKYLSTIL